jgi:hypothetical protein
MKKPQQILERNKKERRNDEKCRLYRQRKKQYEASLIQHVKYLREEVQVLRSIWETKQLKTRHSVQGSLTQLAIEYFKVFRYGMRQQEDQSIWVEQTGFIRARPMAATATATDTATAGTEENTNRMSRQKRFLQCTTGDHFRFNNLYGIEDLCKQWYKYTAYHESMVFTFDQVDIHGQEKEEEEDNLVVIVRGHMQVEFSKETFVHIFPITQTYPQLAEELIGTKIIYPVQTFFGFNSDGEMTNVHGILDFVPALINTLGYQKAMVLCRATTIHHGCLIEEIKEDDDEPPMDLQASPLLPSSTCNTPLVPTLLEKERPIENDFFSIKYRLEYLLNNF